MADIEFQATLEKDGTIAVPEDIGRLLRPGRVRVRLIDPAERVVLDRDEIYDRERDRAWNYLDYLMDHPIHVDRSIPFLTREELHDRRL